MNRSRALIVIFLSVSVLVPFFASTVGSTRTALGEVTLIRTPDGGIQPQTVVDHDRVLHLIYFKGDPEAGDILYVRKEAGSNHFSEPIRVNSQPGSAIAIGSVRGAQIAVGKGSRVHVAWMGSRMAQPRGPDGAAPMLYARLNDAGTAFEPQRNVAQFAGGLDGGSSVAADNFGNVYVTWHGRGDMPGEANRRVWLAHSNDEGKTFSRETAANSEPTGACGCCGMRAFADHKGTLYILYRAATENIRRDMVLLISTDRGRTFQGRRVHNWQLNACPMSTASIGEGGGRLLAAWETAGQVYYATVDPSALKISSPIAAPGNGGDRKHPAVAENARHETILAWEEGTGWKRGGWLAWQVFDAAGRPTDKKGRTEGVPIWGLTAAFADPSAGFTIVY